MNKCTVVPKHSIVLKNISTEVFVSTMPRDPYKNALEDLLYFIWHFKIKNNVPDCISKE